VVLSGLILNLSPVQTYITQQFTAYISKRLGTHVSIGHVSIYFFDRAHLQDILVLDQQQDTLFYAGDINVRLNNFFFLQDDPTLYGLELKHVRVLLQRPKHSETWNYQYIADNFATRSAPDPSDTVLPEWQVQDIGLEDVRFTYKDQWIGTDYYFEAQDFSISGDHIDYKKKKVRLSSVKGEEVLLGILEYTGGRPPRPRRPQSHHLSESTPFNPSGWTFDIGKIDIGSSRFFLEYPEHKAPENFFDEWHLDITGITANIRDITIEGDTVKGNVVHLKAQERCGLAIREFRSLVKVSPNISECSNLYLRTDNSEISDYYAMHYDHFPDFLEYIDRVKMTGNFRKSRVGINDILYFTDAIERIRGHQFELEGKAAGTVAALSSPAISISDGTNSFTGDFTIRQIPDVPNMAITVLNAQLSGNGKDILKYVPELQHQPYFNTEPLGDFKATGHFNGLLNDFDASFRLQGSNGAVAANLKVKNALTGLLQYSGDVQLEHLHIGSLTNVQELGTATLKATFDGTGLSEAQREIHFSTQVAQLEFLDYNYRDIDVMARYNDHAFSGSVLSRDSNFNVDISNGKILFEQNRAHYSLDARLYHINTQALHWTGHPLVGSAEVNMNFTGTNPDDFLGSLLFYNMEMSVGGQPLHLNQFYLSSTISNQKKNVSFLTNGIDANMYGNFRFSTLPDAFISYFSRYFPNYFTATPAGDIQDFDFTIQTKESDDFFRLINIPIRLHSGAYVTGRFNNSTNDLSITGTIPYLSIADYNFSNGQLKIWGTQEGLNQDVTLENFSFGDYEIASTLQLNSDFFNNNGNFSIKTQSINTLGNAEIHGSIRGNSDSFYVNIAPSNIFFNHKKWELQSPNTIIISPGFLYLNSVTLQSGRQMLTLNRDQAIPNNIAIGLHNVETNPINNMMGITEFFINGNINGSVYCTDIFEQPRIAYDLNIDTLYIDDIRFGHLEASGNADLTKSTFSLSPRTTLHSDIGAVQFDIQGNYSRRHPELKGRIIIDEAPMEWIQPFTKDYIHNIGGSFSAKILLDGSIYQPVYSGDILLKDITVTPYITGVPYFIDHHRLKIADNAFRFQNMEIRDALYNKGILNGSITYSGWQHYAFNLGFSSDRIRILSLDKSENDYFYGNIIAQTNVTLTGMINNLRMNVVGRPLRGSRLFIPISSGGDYSSYEYITFKKSNTDRKSFLQAPPFIYNLKIDAIVTPDLEATIILDESTGDKLQVTGNGNIVMEIPSNGAIRLNGNYVIEEGEYNFAFKQMEVLNYQQKFILESGSVIKWTGDLYDADLNVKANARVQARLYDLIANETDRLGLNNAEITDAQMPQPININLNMQGALSQPQLTFRLGLVENRSVGTYAHQKLQRINTSERELLNQVAGLLLLKQFLPPEGLHNTSLSAGAITNMSELFSATASSQLSNLANKLLGVEDLYINLKYKSYALSGYDQTNPANYINRNEAGVNVRKNFFDNRLVTEVGGVYDWGNNNTNYNLAGEFKVQYLLTKDGRIRMNAFRTSNYDAVFQQNIGRQGAGLMFKRSFSGWNDLFNNNKHKDSSKTIQTTPARDTLINTGTYENK